MEKKIQQNQTENVYNIVRDVLKNWWVVLCVALSAAFLAYIVSAVTYHPVYTSSTTFVVSAKSSSSGAYASASKATGLTETFQSVLDSQILKKEVAQSLGMESFAGQVDIAVVPETNLLTVSVTSDSPDTSFKLLRGILENYQEISDKVLGEVVLDVFEEPNYPSGPVAAYSGREIVKKAFLIGALVMIGLLSLLSYQKDGVKTEDDVERKLDTTLFGVLEHESAYRNMKARLNRQRKRLLITEPAVGFGYRESVKKMRTKILYQDRTEHRKGKVLLVTSAARQEGKTTVAANLALSLAQRGKNVLLIEGDLRGTGMAELFGLDFSKDEGEGMAASPKEQSENQPEKVQQENPLENQPEKVQQGNPLDNLLEEGLEDQILQMPETTLNILVNRAPRPKSTEFLLSDEFREFLELMKRKMDIIIIDGPSAKGRADTEVLARQADMSLVVVKQNYSRVPYINDMIDMLNRYGEGVMGCVFNDVYTGGSVLSSGYGYGYGYSYGKYRYGYGYGKYGHYGKYGKYGNYGHEQQDDKSQMSQEWRPMNEQEEE